MKMVDVWKRGRLNLVAGMLLVVQSAVGAGSLSGDCDGDGMVTVDELILGVNISLETSPLSRCPSFDASSDGVVTIDELLRAVNNALNGRINTPTAASTVTNTPSRPAPQNTHTPTAVPPAPSATETPAASFTASVTASASPTATSTSTPTATTTRSRTPTRTATPVERTYCDQLTEPLAIPDGDPSGVGNIIVVDDDDLIADLNVRVEVQHPLVGDLSADVRRIEGQAVVTLLERPGVPAAENGCGNADVMASFDDAAGRIGERECLRSSPAIGGSVQPSTPLHTFDGQRSHGQWLLVLSDNAEGDRGALLHWCLDFNSKRPVVTGFFCSRSTVCNIPFDTSFNLQFGYSDPDGDAVGWRISATRDDGMSFEAAAGSFAAPSRGGSLVVPFDAFPCTDAECPARVYVYTLAITDQRDNESPPLRVEVTVSGAATE